MGIFKRRVVSEQKKVNDGPYVAVVKSVTVKQGKYGEYLDITLKLSQNGVERRAILDTWVGERNLTRKFVDALGIEDWEHATEKDIVGKACIVVLKTVKTKDDREIQKVVDFLPID